MHSPWGQTDHQRKIADGLTWVSTPSHGGFMLIPGSATADRLSQAAKDSGDKCGQALAYEEDCAWRILAWELPDLFPDIDRDETFRCLSSWEPEYLLAAGVEPDPVEFRRWAERQEKIAQHMRDVAEHNRVVQEELAKGWQRIGNLVVGDQETVIYAHDADACWIDRDGWHAIVHGLKFTSSNPTYGNCRLAWRHASDNAHGHFVQAIGNGRIEIYLNKAAYDRRKEQDDTGNVAH